MNVCHEICVLRKSWGSWFLVEGCGVESLHKAECWKGRSSFMFALKTTRTRKTRDWVVIFWNPPCLERLQPFRQALSWGKQTLVVMTFVGIPHSAAMCSEVVLGSDHGCLCNPCQMPNIFACSIYMWWCKAVLNRHTHIHTQTYIYIYIWATHPAHIHFPIHKKVSHVNFTFLNSDTCPHNAMDVSFLSRMVIAPEKLVTCGLQRSCWIWLKKQCLCSLNPPPRAPTTKEPLLI